MSKETIIKLLDQRDKTTGNIVLNLGVSYNAVYHTMDAKKNSSRRIRLEIARLLELPPSFIWAGELDADKLLVDDFHYMRAQNKEADKKTIN